MWDEGGLNAAWHVEQIISTDITPLDAREVFVPGFLISFADGDCRLIADRGNRHCAKALRSAILVCNTGLRDIIYLYEGYSHVEDKT